MKNLIFLGCLAAGLDASHSGAEGFTLQQKVTIEVREKKLVFTPDNIEVDPERLVDVALDGGEGQSVMEFSCFSDDSFENFTAAGLSECVKDAAFRNGDQKLSLRIGAKVGSLRIHIPGRSFQFTPAWLPLAVCLPVAFLSFLQMRRSRSCVIWTKESRTLERDLREVQERINSYTSILRQSTERPANDCVNSEKTELLRQIDCLVAAAEAWCKAAGDNLPFEAEQKIQQVKGLKSVQQPGNSHTCQFREAAVTTARVILNCSDERIDPQFEDSQVQQAIRQVISAAGLVLLHPQKGERMDLAIHNPDSRSERASSIESVNLIARVVRRGLKDHQSTVISKAEVRVYDF